MLAPSAMASRDPAPDLLDGVGQGLAALGGRAPRRRRLAHREQPVDGEGLEARGLAVLVHVHELGQVVAVDDRVGQDDLAARRRRGVEQVALGADGGRPAR